MSESRIGLRTGTVRPRPRTMWVRTARSNIVALILLAAYALEIVSPGRDSIAPTRLWLAALIVLALIGSVIETILRTINERVVFTPTGLTYRGLFRRDRAIESAQIDRVLVATAMANGYRTLAVILLLDADGRRLLHLRSDRWSIEQLWSYIEYVGPIPELIDEPITRAELRRTAPRAVSWAYAHPTIFGLIVIAVILAALGGASLAAAAFGYTFLTGRTR